MVYSPTQPKAAINDSKVRFSRLSMMEDTCEINDLPMTEKGQEEEDGGNLL
jgi:hypothetical protein